LLRPDRDLRGALGAALGAAAGAWGGILIDIHCPNDAVLHLALGHLAPIALFVLLGAALGAHLLGVRTDRRTERG
jgi:hypothetical protein